MKNDPDNILLRDHALALAVQFFTALAGLGLLMQIVYVFPASVLISLYAVGLVAAHIVLFRFMALRPPLWRLDIYAREPESLLLLVLWPISAVIAFLPEYVANKIVCDDPLDQI